MSPPDIHKDPGAFDFYPERFWYSVEGWTESEIARYFRLLCQQWMRDGLPDNRKEMDGLARGKITDRVYEKFPLWVDGKRRNNKLEIERQKQRMRIAKAKEKSQKMLAARYGKQCLKATTSSPQAELKDNLPPTTHVPPQIEIESAGGWPEKIVNAYPRRDSPMESMQAVMDAIDGGEAAETILQSVREVAALCNAAPGGSSNQFIPKAKTFFAERQWRSPEAFKDRWKDKRNGNQSKPTHTGSLNAPGRYS